MKFAYKRYANVQATPSGDPPAYSRFRGYVDGDRLALIFTDIVMADSAEHAREELWRRHNVDDRPDGRLGPSLSVGDVVVLLDDEDRDAKPVAFAVEGAGWSEVPVPANVDPRFWVEIMREFS